MQYDVNIFFVVKLFMSYFVTVSGLKIAIMFKLEAMIGSSLRFYFLPIRLPPVFLDFTPLDANI